MWYGDLLTIICINTFLSGIGKVIATTIIIATNEFKDTTNLKKFACHAGAFTKESGLFKG
jgi:hypothetical protein